MASETHDDPYAYIKRTYGVNPVIGARVCFTETAPNRMGIVVRPASGQYVWVRFDGQRHASPCHPTSLDYTPAPTGASSVEVAE